MFLDESGNHDLNPAKINPDYPIFVLGGVIVDRAYLRNTIEPDMRQFKIRHFGREDVVLHTVDMGAGRGSYGFLANETKRTAYYADLNALLQSWDYGVVVCVFEKARFIAQHPQPGDPYHYGLEILVERFCQELGSAEDAGFICAEKRNPGLDRDLLAAWENLRSSGTGNTRASEINRKIVDLSLKEKSLNIAGLQLADLVITPVGRHVAMRESVQNQVQWTVVERKLLRMAGSYVGQGLIIQP
jgi:hypothetical protein